MDDLNWEFVDTVDGISIYHSKLFFTLSKYVLPDGSSVYSDSVISDDTMIKTLTKAVHNK